MKQVSYGPLTPQPPPTIISFGLLASLRFSSDASSSSVTEATGRFLGPPSLGCRANGETGTRSTCRAEYLWMQLVDGAVEGRGRHGLRERVVDKNSPSNDEYADYS